MPSLTLFQSCLGRALRGEPTCPIDPDSAGFRFTMSVRRSWCEGRAMVAARTVLTLVPEAERRRLVAEYVDAGGGLAMFLPAEKEAFLRFLEPRLPDPSHALSLCLMDQALIRARQGAETFVPPAAGNSMRAGIEREAWDCVEAALLRPVSAADHWRRLENRAWDQLQRTDRCRIDRAPHAALVWFHADPDAVLKALHGGPAPPVGEPTCPLLFAPGLPHLYRVATKAEAALWASLPTDHAEPEVVEPLLAEGVVVRN